MKKQNQVLGTVPAGTGKPVAAGTGKKRSGLLGRILRRFLLVLLTMIVMLFSALLLVLNMVFNGPSPTARDQLTMTLIEASATKWVPALFIGEDTVAEIRSGVNAELEDDVTDVTAVVIKRSAGIAGGDEWADYPDGIRIEDVQGDTYNAKVMIVRDPAQVYLGISTHEGYSTSIPGKRLTAMAPSTMTEPPVPMWAPCLPVWSTRRGNASGLPESPPKPAALPVLPGTTSWWYTRTIFPRPRRRS